MTVASPATSTAETLTSRVRKSKFFQSFEKFLIFFFEKCVYNRKISSKIALKTLLFWNSVDQCAEQTHTCAEHASCNNTVPHFECSCNTGIWICEFLLKNEPNFWQKFLEKIGKYFKNFVKNASIQDILNSKMNLKSWNVWKTTNVKVLMEQTRVSKKSFVKFPEMFRKKLRIFWKITLKNYSFFELWNGLQMCRAFFLC